MPGYQVKFETYDIGDTALRIRSLLDTQQYADPDGIAARAGIGAANWALFGTVWPSGEMLASLMSSHAIGGLRILEVGCGIGLASLLLQSRGADITACDYHPMMPVFLDANTELNALDAIGTIPGDWHAEAGTPALFDLIIGADLLYERDHGEALSAFIDRHAAPDAVAIVIDPGRGYAARFGKRMQRLGFACSHEQNEIELRNGERFRGRVMTCRREDHSSPEMPVMM